MRWMLVLLVACGSREEPIVTRSPDFRASVSGSLDPAFPFGNELSISRGDDVTNPLRVVIEREMRRVMPAATTCMEGIYGTAPLEVELDASGKVTKAKVTKLLEGTPIAACIEKAFSTMQIGAVAGAPIRISYPVRNMPSAEQVRDAADLIKQSL